MEPIRRVAIIGMGMMGGSLGLAIKARCPGITVAAYARRPAVRRQAKAAGACDEALATPAAAARRADLVVFCAPVAAIPDLFNACRTGLKRGALVTDVGSTKAWLLKQVGPAVKARGVHFIGSHPMAGSEKSGLAAAQADLFIKSRVVLTPPSNIPLEQVTRLKKFWQDLGARVLVMSAEKHDRIVARTSHLPHVAAVLLAMTVGRGQEWDDIAALCGPGFADASRLASGSPEMWRDIMETNKRNIMGEILALGQELSVFCDLLEENDPAEVQRFFEAGRSARRDLLAAREAD